ncbi:MAG: radical SAM protein [Alphaproteobacteria bacterium]|nr:radical SAM protein [Alphaproteobacteria bacterium]
MGQGAFPHVTFIRGPIVASLGSVNNEPVPAISLAYLSSAIHQAGYPFSWVDAIYEGLGRFHPLDAFPGYQCQGLTLDEIVSRVPTHTGVIAVNAMFSGEWPVTRELVTKLRARFPGALVIAGGEHVTALTEFSLRDCPGLDVIVRGEGERILCDTLEALRLGSALEAVDGVAFLDDEGAFRQTSPLTRVRDADTLPWPHWPEGYLEKFWADRCSAGVLTDRDMPMTISRGCPFQCAFCSSPNMWTTRYVLRGVEDVIREIKAYVDKYAITSVQLYDLTAITKKKWILEFGQRLLEEGIDLKWSVPQGTRSEILDEETLSLIKKTGCHYLVYAPESGSDRVLKAIKKQVKLPHLEKSVMEARRQGLVLRINLIIGFPGETRLDVLKTAWFGLKMAAKGVDEVSSNIFSPYPGSEIFQTLKASGALQVNDKYFLALTSLNSDYFSLNPLTFNEHMGPRELSVYRLLLILSCYFLSYVLYPKRILRTFRNWKRGDIAETVFEHRIGDALKRRLPFLKSGKK